MNNENPLSRPSAPLSPSDGERAGERGRFVVRLSNQIALKFHRSLMSRNVYSAATDADATQFATRWEAELKARECGMNPRDFFVRELNPQPLTQ